MNYQKTVLSNGLRVVTVPLAGIHSVTALLLIGAGSRYERSHEAGISHFLEHMVFKGTAKRPNAQDIAGAVDAAGGEINAFTSEEYTGFYIKVGHNRLRFALDILSDMVLNATLLKDEIDKERMVIIEEINLYEDNPGRKAAQVYQELLYGETPLGWPIAGTKDSVKHVSRDNFVTYQESLYTPENAVLILAGSISEDGLKIAEHFFSSWKVGESRSFVPVTDPKPGPRLRIFHKKTEQAHLILGFRGFSLGDPTRYAEGLLNVIMGGTMSSRLFVTVRERRGLAYAIRSSSDHFLDVGSWDIYAGVDLLKVKECVRLILDEMKQLAKDGVSKEELHKAREYVIGRLALDLEDSQAVASMIGSQELLERTIRTPEQISAAVRKVSCEDIQAVARILARQDRLHLAIVGPFEQEEQFAQLLHL